MSSYGPFSTVYDKFTYDVDYSAFADFYEKVFREKTTDITTVLDLGCGTGSLTEIMARRGYELIAADSSSEMLSLAQEKCSALTGVCAPLFLCQSATELDLYGTVDAAYASLDVINYLPPEDLPECLRLLHLFIKADGLLIFDSLSPDWLRSMDGYTSVDEDEDTLCLWRADFDEQENALFYGLDIFTRRGRFWQRSSEEHIEYVHEPETLEQQLLSAGFADVEINAFGPQNELGRLFFIAKNTSQEV